MCHHVGEVSQQPYFRCKTTENRPCILYIGYIYCMTVSIFMP